MTEYKFIKPLRITYRPLPDITTFELAQLLPILFTIGKKAIMPIDLPKEESVIRHFVIVDPNKEVTEDGVQ